MKTHNPILFHGWSLAILFTLTFSACQKSIDEPAIIDDMSPSAGRLQGHLKQTKTFSSEVVRSWINMQLSMLRVPLPAGTGSQGSDRSQGYTGIALYEAVVPGMPAYQSLYGQLTDFPMMPKTEPGKAYHWGASANAALAEISRRLFPTTAAANKTAINNLEESIRSGYAGDVDAATIERSVAFGKEVATRVANWAATDGSAIVNPPYVFPAGTGFPPTGTGLWLPTSPNAPPVTPFMSQRRLMVPGSDEGTDLEPLPSFSTDRTSAYFAMVKHVYDVSKSLTDEQKAIANYFKDNPGYSSGGGFVWVLQEALRIAEPTLEGAALTYARVGLATHDVTVILFRNKYIFNVMRPVTYIRQYIDPAWNTYINNPNHPEFPSGHAAANGAVLTMMSHCFGENFPITLHTYDYLGYTPRHYNTFTQMSTDASNSRIYGGLHYEETQVKSLAQGQKVTQNILIKVKFLKE